MQQTDRWGGIAGRQRSVRRSPSPHPGRQSVGGGQGRPGDRRWFLRPARRSRTSSLGARPLSATSWRRAAADTLRLVTPNWQCQLPGYPYAGDDPDGFMIRDEVVRLRPRATRPRSTRRCCEHTPVKQLTSAPDGGFGRWPTTGRHRAGTPTRSCSPPAATTDRSCPGGPSAAARTGSRRCTRRRLPQPRAAAAGRRAASSAPGSPARRSPRTCTSRAARCTSRSGGAPRVARFYRGRDMRGLAARHGPLRHARRRSTRGGEAARREAPTTTSPAATAGATSTCARSPAEGMRLYGRLDRTARAPMLTFAADLRREPRRCRRGSARAPRTSIDRHIAAAGLDAPAEPRYAAGVGARPGRPDRARPGATASPPSSGHRLPQRLALGPRARLRRRAAPRRTPAASPPCPGCTSSACRGCTPGARAGSPASPATPSTSRSTSPTGSRAGPWLAAVTEAARSPRWRRNFGRDIDAALAKHREDHPAPARTDVEPAGAARRDASAATSATCAAPTRDALPPALDPRTPSRSSGWPPRPATWWCASATARSLGDAAGTTPRSVSPATACSGRHRKVHQPAGEARSTPPATVRRLRHPGRADRHAHRLRQDVPRGGPHAGPRRAPDHRVPVGLAGERHRPRRRGWPRTASRGCSTSTTAPGPPRTRWCWVSSNQTGAMGGLRFLGQAKVVGPGGDILARTWAKAGLARRRARRRGRGRPGPAECCTHLAERPTATVPEDLPMRIALLTYSTKPRGGVVHTLALAEALAARGAGRHGLDAGPRRRRGFFRPVDPAVRCGSCRSPTSAARTSAPGSCGRSRCCGAAFARPATLRRRPRPGLHQRQRRARPCIRTIHHLDQLHHTGAGGLPRAGHRRAACARICVSAAVAAEVRAGWGSRPTVIPNGVDAARFAAAAAPARPPGRGPRGAGGSAATCWPSAGSSRARARSTCSRPWRWLRRRRPDLRLVVAGGETLFDYRDYRAAFDARAAELGVDPEVLGAVAARRAARRWWPRPACSPSRPPRRASGWPRWRRWPPACRVVARDLPVLREVFDSAAAFATDPEGLAAELLAAASGTHPSRRATGRALAARHTWDGAAAAHLDVYCTRGAKLQHS